MRHGDKVNNLSRKKGHRRALLANMAIALIEHKRINTTLAKAKALRRYMEPLITKSRKNSTHSRRVVFSHLQNKDAVTELFGPIADKIGDRPGGYLRIIKLGFRRGDGAEVAMIEFVDFNETYNPNAHKEKSGKKRTRRGGSKAAAEATPADQVVETADEAVDTVEETVEAVEDQVETAAEEVTEAVEEAKEEVAEAAEEVKEEVAEAAEKVEDKVEDAAEEVADAAEDAAADATEEKPADDEEKKDA